MIDIPADPMALTGQWLGTDLDEWTRAVLRRTFDPELGSPYWLARARGLDFDPRDIKRYDELAAFGPFPLAVLREEDPRSLVPLAASRPLTGRIWDSGGTTGDPCHVFYTPDMIVHRGVWRRWSFVAEGFEAGRSWLQATPTGPHLIGNGTWEVAELFSSLVYAIDMDPRWIKRLIRDTRLRDVADYTAHLVEQMAAILRYGRIAYVNTTPALFAALLAEYPRLVETLSGVRLSGTQISGAMYREFRAALRSGPCGLSYGNTFGNAAGLPAEEDGELLPYVPNYPQVTMAVVAKDDWLTPVRYGENGQVRLTVLHEDLFLPNILERDQAIRYDTGGEWPCDGVANVRPLQVTTAAPEGLY